MSEDLSSPAPRARAENIREDLAELPRIAGRVAQFLLGIPLGLFQLAAVIGFTVTAKSMTGMDWLVAVWGLFMSTSCAAVALRVYHSARARRMAFALLAARALFSIVKLTVYHESASLVFLVIIALTVMTLAAYQRRNVISAEDRSPASLSQAIAPSHPPRPDARRP